MSTSTRTITIKFATDTKGVTTGAAIVETALSRIGGSKSTSGLSKITSGLDKLSRGMDSAGSKALKAGIPLLALEKTITALSKAGPALSEAAGAFGVLPGAIAVAGSAIAVLKVGAAGLKAAFANVGTTTQKSLVKVFETQLAPAASRLKKTLSELTPALDGVASSESKVISGLIKTASTGANVGRLNNILDATRVFVGNIGAALVPLEDAFITVAAVAAPIFARLTSTVGDFANKFDKYIHHIASNGELDIWINNGISKIYEFADRTVAFFREIAPIVHNLAGIKITLFDSFTPAIIPILTVVSKLLKDNPDLAGWLVGVGLGLKLVAPLVRGLAAALDLLETNPIVLLIFAIAALVAAFVILWNKSAGFRSFWIGLWNDILRIAQPVISWFQNSVVPTFQKIWTDVKTILSLFAQAWSVFWNSSLGGVAKAALGVLWGLVKFDLSLIKGLFIGVMTVIVGALKGSWTIIKAVFSGAFQIIEGLLNIFIAIFTGNWSRAWKGIKEVLSGAWTIISGVVKGIGQTIEGVFSGIVRGAISVGHTLGSIFSGIGRSIVNGLKSSLNVGIGLINGLINTINAVTGLIGIPKIPRIPHLAKGGTAHGGQPYLVGENGPELFTPGQTGRVTDAAQTAAMAGDGGDVVIMLDGDVFARIAKREINSAHRQLKTKVLSGGSR